MSSEQAEVLKELNTKCLNRDKEGHVKWNAKRLVEKKLYGNDSEYGCIYSVYNKRSRMCSECTKIIAEYKDRSEVAIMRLEEKIRELEEKIKVLESKHC